MYLIKFKTRVNGETKVYYHENLSINAPKRGFCNTYCQHITTDKSKALLFFLKKEAERMANFFEILDYSIVKK